MNEHIGAHVFKAGKELRGNYRKVLYIIANHSCVVSGVSWIGKGTIATELGTSEKTVTRAIDRLKKLGIIRQEILTADGMIFRYWVFNRFELSKELSSKLSMDEEAPSPTAPRVQTHFQSDEPKESKEPNNKHIVVEQHSIPISITQLLQRHKLSVNPSTIMRWLSSATEETIGNVINYAINKRVRNVIGYITAILIQGWTAPKPSSKPAQAQKSRDIVPHWITAEYRPSSTEQLNEEQKRQAAELLRELGEIVC